MGQLPFNMALMQFLAEQRNVFLTKFFLLASFLGEVEGYILVITLIYVMFDKRLAVRLAVLVLLTMSLNHVLKIIIKNPRPFIREGDYLKKWAVSAENAKELAAEYSTPSGHAMAGCAFYSYLYKAVGNPYVRLAAVIAILFTGLSRPYLGVHFLEDIFAGWVIGLSVALVAVKYAQGISKVWNKFSYKRQVAVVVGTSLVLWLVTITINGWRVDGQPRAFLGYAGFLTGIVIGHPLELSVVNFDPRSSTWTVKILRYIISVGMVVVTLQLLGKFFGRIADNFSMLGYVLQYVRYTFAGVVSILLVPGFLVKVRLAESNPIRVGRMEHL